MTVLEIVKEYLLINKFDGLFGRECGCHINNLAPCKEIPPDCHAGYEAVRNGLKGIGLSKQTEQ